MLEKIAGKISRLEYSLYPPTSLVVFVPGLAETVFLIQRIYKQEAKIAWLPVVQKQKEGALPETRHFRRPNPVFVYHIVGSAVRVLLLHVLRGKYFSGMIRIWAKCFLFSSLFQLGYLVSQISKEPFINKISLMMKEFRFRRHMRKIIALDSSRNLELISSAIFKSVKEHGLTLQQIETALRTNNCYTYLIARRRNDSFDSTVDIQLPSKEQKTYFLFVSTKNEEEALQELKEESSSYEENFQKLNDTGFMILREGASLLNSFKQGTLSPNRIGWEQLINELEKSR